MTVPSDSFEAEQVQNDNNCVQESTSQPAASQPFSHPEEVVVDNQTIFSAEKILELRKRSGKGEYLVEWLGYPKNQSTWEPEENILDKRLIENLEKSNS